MAQPVRRTEEVLFDLDSQAIHQLLLFRSAIPCDAVPFLALLDLQLPETLPFDLFESSPGGLLFRMCSFTLCAARSAFLLLGVALSSLLRGTLLALLVEDLCSVAVDLRPELSDRPLVALVGLN